MCWSALADARRSGDVIRSSNPMGEFAFREAVPADGPSIRAVVFEVLRAYGLSPDPATTDADLEDINASYSARGGCFRVVVAATGDIVGCGGLYPVGESDAEIRKMYLLKQARGRGLGRKLLEDLIDIAKERGFRSIVVETASVLREAVALYRSTGFVPLERDHWASRCDQAYVLHLAPKDSRAG
jgi:putative acetyltransferase